MAESQATLQRQITELSRLREEAARLSNTLSHATTAQPLSDAEFRDVLRLRGKVGLLQAELRQAAELQSSNQWISAALSRSKLAPPAESHWTREQLGNAGFADPQSAIITTFWVLNNDDAQVQASMLDPEEKAFHDAQASNGIPVDVAAYCRKVGALLNPPTATGIQLVRKTVNSPDEVLLDIYYDGEGKTRRFRMVRVGEAWRLADLVSITVH